MKQHEAVILAMQQIGGYATLGQLYQAVPKIPGCIWKTKTPFASIRRIVQTHEEFFKIRPGLWALTSKKEIVLRLFSDERVPDKEREYSHYFFQGLVVEIGNLKGFETFIPSQDKNKPYANQTLGNVATLSKLYEFTFTDILRKARLCKYFSVNSRARSSASFEEKTNYFEP
jgi:hypothetical protein